MEGGIGWQAGRQSTTWLERMRLTEELVWFGKAHLLNFQIDKFCSVQLSSAELELLYGLDSLQTPPTQPNFSSLFLSSD